MPISKVRINIPKNPSEKISLAQKVNVKHVADGDASPLKLLQANSWDTVGPAADECFIVHGQAEEMSRKAEELYRKRDALLLKIDDALKSSRNLLMGVYRSEPKKLGEWGFEVDDTPRPAKAKKPQV